MRAVCPMRSHERAVPADEVLQRVTEHRTGLEAVTPVVLAAFGALTAAGDGGTVGADRIHESQL
jgi:hypothetical protein